eukprot:scaffold1111_cov253-Pinguiococcus_pyrenoidosus.AAC.4
MNTYTRGGVDLMRSVFGGRAPRFQLHMVEQWEQIYERYTSDFEWAGLSGYEFLEHKYVRPTESYWGKYWRGDLRHGTLPKLLPLTSVDTLRVLELGCGQSALSAKLYDADVSKDIVAVDFSPKAIEFCKDNFARPGVAYEVADARELSEDLGTFDVVLDKGTIDANWCSAGGEKGIAEISASVYRALRPNGVFLSLSFTAPDYLVPFHRDIGEVLKTRTIEDTKEEPVPDGGRKEMPAGKRRRSRKKHASEKAQEQPLKRWREVSTLAADLAAPSI